MHVYDVAWQSRESLSTGNHPKDHTLITGYFPEARHTCNASTVVMNTRVSVHLLHVVGTPTHLCMFIQLAIGLVCYEITEKAYYINNLSEASGLFSRKLYFYIIEWYELSLTDKNNAILLLLYVIHCKITLAQVCP